VQIFTSPPRRVRRVRITCAADELSGEVLHIESRDGACFVVPVEVAAHSLCLAALCQPREASAVIQSYSFRFREQEQGRVLFPTLSAVVLERVLQFCFHDHLVNGPDLRQSAALAPPPSPVSVARSPPPALCSSSSCSSSSLLASSFPPSSAAFASCSASASTASLASATSSHHRKRPATSFRSPHSSHASREVRTAPHVRGFPSLEEHRSPRLASLRRRLFASLSDSDSDEDLNEVHRRHVESDENAGVAVMHSSDDATAAAVTSEEDGELTDARTRLSAMECSELEEYLLTDSSDSGHLPELQFGELDDDVAVESLGAAERVRSPSIRRTDARCVSVTGAPACGVRLPCVSNRDGSGDGSPTPLCSPSCSHFQNPLRDRHGSCAGERPTTTWCSEYVEHPRQHGSAASYRSSAMSAQLRQRRVFCFEIPPHEVMDLLMAAHFLGISSLQERACQMVADNALAVSSFEGLPDEVVHQILEHVTPQQLLTVEKLLAISHPSIGRRSFVR
jgi:hypothetical protein